MQSDFRPPRISLQYKLVLTHLAVTLAAVLIAEAMALGILALIQPEAVGGPHFALVIVSAAMVGLLLGMWASRL